MLCRLCEKIEKESDMKIYEDPIATAFLKEKPASLGHISILPKLHSPILEQLPDKIISHLFVIANKLSTALFDVVKCQGTNIIINNGVSAGQKHSHFSINIIPRTENDDLKFEWQPKQLNEEELSTIELKLKEHTANIGIFEKEEEKPLELNKKGETISGEENYLIRHLRRPA